MPVGHINSYADRDAAVVRILREAGAIIYVKTANPQTLLVSPVPFPLVSVL
jgi:Asp-tRNA(Asn)/Glu-tRNA(Gln) amidotransferase A subunit family amidase